MNQIKLAAIDLNLLVVLDVLLDEASVTAAAKRLGRTQSAISHALGRLRELFGDPILVRTGASMRATPRAEALRAPLADLLRATEALVRSGDGFDPATATRRVRVLASDYLQLVLLLPLLEQVREAAPGLDLEVHGPRTETDRALAEGDLDLALVVGERPGAGIHRQALVDDRFVCVARRDHPQLDERRRTIELDRFVAVPHALIAPAGNPGSIVDAALRELGRHRRVAVMLPDFAVALRLIARSDLLLTLPERFVDALIGSELAEDGELRRFEPPLELPTLDLGVRWHDRVANDPAITWLRERLVATSAALPRLAKRRRPGARKRGELRA